MVSQPADTKHFLDYPLWILVPVCVVGVGPVEGPLVPCSWTSAPYTCPESAASLTMVTTTTTYPAVQQVIRTRGFLRAPTKKQLADANASMLPGGYLLHG